MLKTFTSATMRRGEPLREWNGLQAMSGTGRSPKLLALEITPTQATISMELISPVTTFLTSPQVDQNLDALLETVNLMFTARPQLCVDRIEHPTDLVRNVLAWIPPDLSQQPDVVVQALAAATAWLDKTNFLRLLNNAQEVFTNGDGNPDNYLLFGTTVYVVDFENSGRSLLEFELAELSELSEHINLLPHRPNQSLLAALGQLGNREWFFDCRRLMSIWWLQQMLPSGRAYRRNPTSWTIQQALYLQELLA